MRVCDRPRRGRRLCRWNCVNGGRLPHCPCPAALPCLPLVVAVKRPGWPLVPDLWPAPGSPCAILRDPMVDKIRFVAVRVESMTTATGTTATRLGRARLRRCDIIAVVARTALPPLYVVGTVLCDVRGLFAFLR